MGNIFVDWGKTARAARISSYKFSINLYELQKSIVDLIAVLEKKEIDLKIEEQKRRLHDLENGE